MAASVYFKRKQNSQLSIEKWTSAFMIYMSIMFEHNPALAQQMLKYLRDIRIAASRSHHWYKYDEQFRLRKVSNPAMSWGDIHNEFWLLYVTNQSTNFHVTARFRFSISTIQQTYNTWVFSNPKTS